MPRLLVCLLALVSLLQAQTVKSLKIRILSTMLTSDDGIGEWGFAALVADSRIVSTSEVK